VTVTAVRVRPLVAGDLTAVLEVERASFPLPWSEAQFREEMAQAVARLFVAEDGGGVVATATTRWVAGELQVLNVAVAPWARRRGVAAALVAEVARRAARDGGCTAAFLEVRRGNQAALALYRSLGFRESGLRRGYYEPDGEDAVLMEAPLGPGGLPGRGAASSEPMTS
jgi:ribosomal-protein-alanine N-acetyltransferase